MKSSLLRKFAFVLFAGSGLARAAQEVPLPVAVPYEDRKLLATDSFLLDWKDAARNRDIPVKVYYPTEGQEPFPLIIFSHGLGGTREGYEYLGRQWAANGYIVIHLQHHGSDDEAWKGQAQPMQSMRQAASFQNAMERDKDVHFALDQIDSLNEDDTHLNGKIDPKEIGMAGHSFGAQTTALIAGQKFAGPMGGNLRDDRVKAAIAMSVPSPIMQNNLDEVYAQIQMPIFYMTGTKDDSPIGDTKAAQRRDPFDHTKASATYLLIFNGGDHMTFSGRLIRNDNDEKFQKRIRLASTAFWDAYLRNDAAAKKWLDDGGFKQELGDEGTIEHK